MKVYVLDVAPLRLCEEEALARLYPERREKALRIRREEARLLSIGAGLLLCAAGLEPPYSYGGHGKPFVPGGRHFSLTHSGSLAALALHAAPVGLDAERIAPVRRAAARALTPEERRYMADDPERRFAYLWTRKEAVLKCTGDGLSLPMHGFAVLEDTAWLGDTAFALCTVPYGGAMLSAATADGPADFMPQTVEALELLQQEDALWN